ncbi:hypothetical protein AB0P32_03915 [Streptomyces sp. NPDC085995]|uniref:hypothetical protein n=1 Tax=Streptomyces sp. NPDC085995 TaxID=3154861 RepID=UPI00341675BF
MTAPADLDTARVRAAAIKSAARIWRHGLDAMDRMTVTDAARACYQPGGPSLAELEQRITADRAARHRGAQPSRPAAGSRQEPIELGATPACPETAAEGTPAADANRALADSRQDPV